MKWTVSIAVLAIVAVTLTVGSAVSAPQPKAVPTDWQFEFTFKAPQPIQVRVPGIEEIQTYWYVLYTVTNNTGSDRTFVPDFTLYTDTGQIVHGGEGAWPSVFEEIQGRHNNPLLQVVSGMTGALLQGQEYAKDGVAIFRDFDPAARAFDLFIGGLSGETIKISLPRKVMVSRADVEGRETLILDNNIVLRRTLHLSYKLPSEAAARFATPAIVHSRQWIMR
ncbi:MAG: hypothetical protein HQ546_09390 [Planctomycetes bacterium]|nr:hypothetical protein [Planctomycetota bacterium]